MQENTPLLRTSLFEVHRAAGGKLVPFAGWEMPVQYEGVKAETLAVRNSCGLFDVSHMGQLDVSGPGVTEALNAVVSADWSTVAVGRSAYGLLLTEDGGVQDDIMGYKLADDRWLVVVNASRADVDEAHFRAQLPESIQLANRYDNQAMIAIQGPDAEALFQKFCDLDLSPLKIRDVREVTVLGQPAIIARGGYTGCDGFEWMGDAATAAALWEKLIEAGAAPAGLGARDILRLEAGLPLYGHELREEWTPDESNVNFAVKPQKGPFFGRDALVKRRETVTAKTLRGVKMQGKAIAREGYPVVFGGEEIGVVTSGSPSPTLEANIALALISADLPLGGEVEISIRGTLHMAQIVALPFVPRTTKTTATAVAAPATS
ncbi:glycine cleavage system aminomethyltransferase GcvT [bacterium]|nr:MAG: glycine cleavage system aminomethyltransferase GcvT [bacterium]